MKNNEQMKILTERTSFETFVSYTYITFHMIQEREKKDVLEKEKKHNALLLSFEVRKKEERN